MHHLLYITIAIWIIFDIPTWCMLSGFLRKHSKYEPSGSHGTILMCMGIIGGPVSFITIIGLAGYKHWAWRPETTKEVNQRLMLRKLEE